MESSFPVRIINKKNIIFPTAKNLGTEKKQDKKKRVNLVLVNRPAFTGNFIIDQPEYRISSTGTGWMLLTLRKRNFCSFLPTQR
jgi:hypothetical protein